MSDLAMNEQGGVYYSPAEMKRAKSADLGTLPIGLAGTNCSNCSFFRRNGTAAGVWKVGFCNQKSLRLLVSERQCCAYWTHPDFYRQWL